MNTQPVIAMGDWSVYSEGDLLYDAMLEDLQAASRSIRVESYIVASDAVGEIAHSSLVVGRRPGATIPSMRSDCWSDFGQAIWPTVLCTTLHQPYLAPCGDVAR